MKYPSDTRKSGISSLKTVELELTATTQPKSQIERDVFSVSSLPNQAVSVGDWADSLSNQEENYEADSPHPKPPEFCLKDIVGGLKLYRSWLRVHCLTVRHFTFWQSITHRLYGLGLLHITCEGLYQLIKSDAPQAKNTTITWLHFLNFCRGSGLEINISNWWWNKCG